MTQDRQTLQTICEADYNKGEELEMSGNEKSTRRCFSLNQVFRQQAS